MLSRRAIIGYGFVLGAALVLLAFPLVFTRLSLSGYHGMRLDSAARVPDFRLRDLDGRDVRLADLRGSYLYVFFGYSRCDGICPRALGELYRFAREAPGDEEGIGFRILFLSIDPARDRPAHLKAFFESFGARFLVLRDGDERVQEVARRFGVHYTPPESGRQDYQINHPELVYVLGPGGEPVLLYTNTAAPNLLADWTRLRRIQESTL